MLDDLDKMVLNLVQDDFPVHPRPYDVLAEKISKTSGWKMTGLEFLERVRSLRGRGFLRRLGGIFNSGPLGYRSTLCAAVAPEEVLEKISDMVNQRPEITHNYLRDDEVNLWFTFCHGRQESLDAFLAELRAVEGIGEIFELPARKVYKIRAVFDLPL
ncbi:MAG: Lrp/AsnC family transcriptional regulator [Deltaproteobacteria bacterium]|jgi:DNA-binding Lrp family transcriptional regulator|nr:Lrp/AsnC family transcriptional regulator [Deltaproteobacteria bacterium]